MKLKRGSTSVRRLIFIADATSTTGAGLANLTSASAGLVCWYFAGDLSNDLQITLVTGTLGTYTSGGFVAVDNTNMPGWYELGIPNAALDGGNGVCIQLRGAANMVPVNIYIELDAVNYQDASGFGLSRLDVATSTRLAAVDYVEPSNGVVADIADQLSLVAESVGNIQLQVANLMYDGDGYLYVNVMAVNGSSSAAGKLELFAANGVAGGSGHVHVATLPVDSIGSVQLAVSAVAEIQSGLATMSVVNAIKTTTDKLDTTMQLDSSVYQFTQNALSLVPTSDATLVNQETIIAMISGGRITSNSPVTSKGQLNGPIVKGDDYLASSSRAFDWFVDPGSFDIGLATCWFGGARQADPETSSWKVQGVVSPVTIEGQLRWRLRFELTTSVTGLLMCDLHEWSVELRGPSDENITKIFGQVRVANSYTK